MIIAAVCLVVLLVAGGFYGAHSENKVWNNGACPCGKGFWVHFDMNSQGGHGYKCSEPNCKTYIWQSWRDRSKVK